MNPMSGFFFADSARPATTTAGPWSPPIASTLITVLPASCGGADCLVSDGGAVSMSVVAGRSASGRVFVQVDLVDRRHDFPVGIVAAGRADVVRTLELAA